MIHTGVEIDDRGTFVPLIDFGNRAELDGELTSGGSFNSGDPSPEQEGGYGTLVLTFESCSRMTVDYDLTGPGLSGSINMQRVADDNVALCEALLSE